MTDLGGRRVLVTRSRKQASKLSAALREAGAEPIECPVLDIEPLESFVVRAALHSIHSFDSLVFTSQNGVRAFADLVQTRTTLPRVYTIGPATAAEAKKRLRAEARYPERHYVAESLLRLMIADGVVGKSYLLLLADETRDVLAKGLREGGAEATVVPIYRSVIHPRAADQLALLLGRGLDAITIASSKTMEFLHRATPEELRPALRQVPIVSIGPITTATAIAMGYDVAAEAEESTIASLVTAVGQALG